MKRVLLTFVLSIVVSPAVAAPVTWVLNDVIFPDGGTASGYFVFDRDPNAIDGDYLEISISTTAGTDAPGRNYVGHDSFRSAPIQLVALDSADEAQAQWVLLLAFDSPLDDSGGVRSLVSIQEAMCGSPTCVPVDQIARSAENSSATISAVPVPAAAWLFGSALGLLGWMKRRTS